MRILFISNLYPPLARGGLEQSCQEMVSGLQDKGHPVCVLTSRLQSFDMEVADPSWVQRVLNLEMDFASFIHAFRFFTSRKSREQENLALLRRFVQDFKPEIIFIWGMWNLPRSLASLAEQLLPGRVVYYIADYWPTLPTQHALYWQQPAKNWVTRIPKTLLRPLANITLRREKVAPLSFPYVIFVSRFLQKEYERLGIAMGKTVAIDGAIDTDIFLQGETLTKAVESRLSLLYAGRFSPEKGVETAIQALKEIVHQHRIRDIYLTLVGGGDSTYEAQLRDQIRSAGLEAYITFRPSVPKEAMPRLYREFDVVLFPSIWQEPFGRVVVEAMAAGIAVIGTATGGAAEVLINGENGLAFPPGDHGILVEQLLKLRTQPELRQKLVENGRRTAVERFDNRRMVAEIEEFLERLLAPAVRELEVS